MISYLSLNYLSENVELPQITWITFINRKSLVLHLYTFRNCSTNELDGAPFLEASALYTIILFQKTLYLKTELNS